MKFFRIFVKNSSTYCAMEFIKQNFSIKDLEHMSGIKAHTIRIWEKRYSILHPERSDSNIRTYDINNLQKILNIAFLKKNGYKISLISEMPENEMANLVKKVGASTSIQNRAVNAMKVAMINFDKSLFIKTYEHLLKIKIFREIFYEVFLPLLSEIGLLWQTGTINPVHEHFISGLIKEKIYQNIALLQNDLSYEEKDLYILFLPEQEIHDMGILYVNYELNFYHRKTLFLGPGIPMENMRFIFDVHPNLKFVSYLTVTLTDVSKFIKEFNLHFCQEKTFELNLFGAQIQSLDPTSFDSHIKIFKSIPEFVTSFN